MIEEAACVEEARSPAESPLVAVSFQRNIHRKEKYLEAEPKALGALIPGESYIELGYVVLVPLVACCAAITFWKITQIGLSVFQATCTGVFLSKGLRYEQIAIPVYISSVLTIIAGSLAVAAKSLHLPTLRACFGMQIVASAASIFNMICSQIMADGPSVCFSYDYYGNSTTHDEQICQKIESTMSHLHTEEVLTGVALLAISLSLAVYCGKVINCCFPAPKMPVITVHAPPVQQ